MLGGFAKDAVRPAVIEPQCPQLTLNSPHGGRAISVFEHPQRAAQLAPGAAFDDHLCPVGDRGVELLRVMNLHADAPMGRAVPNGLRLVGAVDAVIPPGDVQPQEAGAEAAHLPGKPVGDGEHTNGRWRIPGAGGHGVGLHDAVILKEGEAFLLHIHMDDIGGSHGGRLQD